MPTFTLTMRDPKTQETSRLFYTTETSDLIDEAGGSVVEKQPAPPETETCGVARQRMTAPSVKVHPDRPVGKIRRIRHLKIQLGLGCNYSCAYCSQASYAGAAAKTSRQDALDFLAGLDGWIEGAPEKVEFWGGEPLLYWAKIEVLAPALRERWPDARFSVITNGSLLDEAKIDFLDRHGFSVTISHDGPGQAVRGPDPMDDPVMIETWRTLFTRLPQRSGVHAVLTPGNHNATAIIDWFQDRFDMRVHVSFEGIMTVHGSGDVGEFDMTHMMRDVMDSFYNGHAQAFDLYPSLSGFLRSLKERWKLDNRCSKCGMDQPDTLAVDLAGNALTCHSTAGAEHILGNVSDFDAIRLTTATHFSHREGCMRCPVIHLCGGSCMYLAGEDWRKTCDNEYHYNLALMSGALLWLTGKQLIHVSD